MVGLDCKKEYKDLYQPKNHLSIINVPEMTFIQAESRGNPNTCQAYKDAMEILYGLSSAIKVSKMSDSQPAGHFEYVAPSLGGLWQCKGNEVFDGITVTDKSKFCWFSIIRQPKSVTEDMSEWAKESLRKKKPCVGLTNTRLVEQEEELCAQMMHLGPYDDEPVTVALFNQLVEDNGYDTDTTDTRHHREIYLGDPREAASERPKTVLRHPVKKHR